MCLHTGKAIALPQENTISILGEHLTNPGETPAEWVVHVPKGLAAAELMAQQNGLHVLGEVIPDRYAHCNITCMLLTNKFWTGWS